MHSSRMRTARTVTIGGGSGPEGGSAPGGSGPGGGLLPGVGGIPTPPVDRHTPVKT